MAGRLISCIWEHFSKPNEQETNAVCKYCANALSYYGGSTGNLIRHLRLKHKIDPLTSKGKSNRSISPSEIPPIVKEIEIEKISEPLEPPDLDSSLPLKIKKYMKENKHISLEELTEHLMNNYDEFRNKRKKPFMKIVNKVYLQELKKNKSDVSESSANEDEDNISVSEEEFMYSERESSPDCVEVSTPIKENKKSKSNTSSSFSIGTLYRKQSPATNGVTNCKVSKRQQETPQSNKRKRLKSSSPTPPSEAKKSDAKELVPTCTLSDFIGKESVLGIGLLNKYLNGDQRLHLPRTSVISGAKGSGKSMLVECLAGHLRYPLYRISASELSGGNEVDIKEVLSEIKNEAFANSPCILHFDKLDDVTSSKDSCRCKRSERRIIDQLKQLSKEIATKHSTKQVLLLIESRSQVIDPELLLSIDSEIMIPVFDKDTKILLLKELFFERGWLSSDVHLDDIIDHVTSFVAGDLKSLAKKAALQAGFREMSDMAKNQIVDHKYYKQTDLPDIEIKMEDILTVLPTIKSTLKEGGFPHPSNVKWEDVYGLEDVKKSIMRKIISPIKDKEIFAHFGIEKPNGILLYGPPGCGKTLLGKAVANAAGINLLSVKGSELLLTDQGESERNVREVFRRAESAAPCLIFFDEFDYLCPKRTGNADNESKHDVVETLLIEMNGLDKKHEVYVIAATNRPEFIDPLVFRSNRIGTRLCVGLPDDKGKTDILQSCAKKQKVQLDSDVDFEEIASWCGNFSGADCSSLLKAACEEAIMENHSMYKEGKLDLEDIKVKKSHFETALTIVENPAGTEAHEDFNM